MLLPEGQYEAEAIDLTLGYTSTGKEQFVVTFKVLGPENRMLKTLSSYRVFEGNSPETTQKMRDMRMKELDTLKFDWTNLGLPSKPERVLITVEHEPDMKDPSVIRDRVQWINSTTRGAQQKKPMTEAERLAFAARMKVYANPSGGTPGDAKEPSVALATSEPEPWESDGAWEADQDASGTGATK